MSSATLQTNENNDLFLPDGRNLVVLQDLAALPQNVLQATLMRLAENIYNTNEGVDYFGTVFTPQQSYAAARKSLIDNIESVPDVISVQSLNITITENTFNYQAYINSVYGVITVSA